MITKYHRFSPIKYSCIVLWSTAIMRTWFCVAGKWFPTHYRRQNDHQEGCEYRHFAQHYRTSRMSTSREHNTSYVMTHILCPTTARCPRLAVIPLVFYGRQAHFSVRSRLPQQQLSVFSLSLSCENPVLCIKLLHNYILFNEDCN